MVSSVLFSPSNLIKSILTSKQACLAKDVRYVASSFYFFTRNSQAGSTKDVRYVASSAEAHLTFRFNLCRRDGATCLSRIQREVDKDFVVEECTKKLL